MIVIPYFHFHINCNEAIKYYKKVIDVKVLCLFTNEGADSKDHTFDCEYAEHVNHSEIMLGKSRLTMSDIAEDI